ncbi:LytR/AlgR family response regulator transcription factor [Pontibacter rugosus]|uniref:LytR/AlgR family response regulator transcription factor n=1 Tax=Pontibacter rugosus TaxID=1745966 RepID=A0ABW3SSB6_9BACT
MKLRTIIVDDEAHARNILTHYLGKLPDFELVGQYDNCFTCFDSHDFDEVDLLLLDINLPTISGLNFSHSLAKYKVQVVFTTAYSEYALESYEHNAIDYLLKPIEFDRFSKAMEKAKEMITLKQTQHKPQAIFAAPALAEVPALTSLAELPKSDFIFIKADYKIIKLYFDNITFIESLQEYVRIHLKSGKPIVTLQTLKHLVEVLPASKFIRIHRSYIINVDQLEYVQQRSIVVAGQELKIGKNYWDDFYAYLTSQGLL